MDMILSNAMKAHVFLLCPCLPETCSVQHPYQNCHVVFRYLEAILVVKSLLLYHKLYVCIDIAVCNNDLLIIIWLYWLKYTKEKAWKCSFQWREENSRFHKLWKSNAMMTLIRICVFLNLHRRKKCTHARIFVTFPVQILQKFMGSSM